LQSLRALVVASYQQANEQLQWQCFDPSGPTNQTSTQLRAKMSNPKRFLADDIPRITQPEIWMRLFNALPVPRWMKSMVLFVNLKACANSCALKPNA